MILNCNEKECFVKSLSWMIEDLKHRHDELKGNLEEGSQGDYSPELKAAMGLLGDVKKVETTETTGSHRKSTLLNCREFVCVSNRQGICAASKITLESKGVFSMVGDLKCVESERLEIGVE